VLGRWSAAGRDRIVQVAVGGRWEEARRIELPDGDARARPLVRDAGPPGADVAVEFEWLGHPLVFVGARRGPGGPGEEARFEEGVARVAALDPDDPALALATLAGGTPDTVDHVELGAANAWRSVGPLRLWTRGDEAPERDVAARLREHPALARCVAPVALEVAFARPRECWIGIELSTPAGAGHVVAPAAVDAMLARLFASGR
jgi:hypothetical protein